MFKKFLILSAFLCFVIYGVAQTTEEREVGEFNQVRLWGSMTAELIQGDKNSVYIESEELPLEDINIENDDRELKIKVKPDILSKHEGDELFIKITHKEEIESLHALADADVSFDKPILRKDFKLNVGSGAHVVVKINSKKLNVKAYQGGQAQITGKVVNLEAYINSGGILSATSLVCQNADVKLNTGGKGEITVKKELVAKVTTGADFSYMGNPVKENTKTSLGGTISAWDQEEEKKEDKKEEESEKEKKE